MKKVIYGQYDANAYPLKRFYEDELPDKIRELFFLLSHQQLAVFRGGLAFVFLLNEKKYLLKDIDMMAYSDNKDVLLDYLKCAEIVYVNKNTFGDSVITAFWKADDEYYKLDILLCNKMTSLCERIINGKSLYIVSASYLWRNRIEKIAEKNIRKHDNKKTLNHFYVAHKLSQYLIESRELIFEEDINVVIEKLSDLQLVLSKMITERELEQFMKLQFELVRGEII